jgi:curli production assembly/transport component CsgG
MTALRLIPLIVIIAILQGCATGSAIREKLTGNQFDEPVVENSKFLKKKENILLPPVGGPIPVAVYSFSDKTGQRKSVTGIASLSSAVTQGAESYLIKALQDSGDGRWFIPVERVGIDNLIKERQMIRQARELYQGKDAQPLPPMVFAGIIMEGGIIGYDSNTLTGGNGMRVFGIGATTQYQSDTVTVNLRTVSVSTGEILTSVTVTKTVLSYMDKLTLLRFVNDPGITDPLLAASALAIEGEIGGSINESINRAIDVTVQAAVIGTIQQGARKGHWGFKQDKKEVSMPPLPAHVEKPVAIPGPNSATSIVLPKPVAVTATEAPKETPKNDMVPNNNEPKKEVKTQTVPNKPNGGASPSESKAVESEADQDAPGLLDGLAEKIRVWIRRDKPASSN